MSRSERDPVARVSVQMINKGESILIAVPPREFWETVLRPVLLTGFTVNGIPHELEEQSDG